MCRDHFEPTRGSMVLPRKNLIRCEYDLSSSTFFALLP